MHYAQSDSLISHKTSSVQKEFTEDNTSLQSKNICDAVNCIQEATTTVIVNVDERQAISLSLCKSCASSKFREINAKKT